MFFLDFENFCDFNDVAQEQRTKLLWSMLKGKAKEWVQLIICPDSTTAYNTIKDTILLAFLGHVGEVEPRKNMHMENCKIILNPV